MFQTKMQNSVVSILKMSLSNLIPSPHFNEARPLQLQGSVFTVLLMWPPAPEASHFRMGLNSWLSIKLDGSFVDNLAHRQLSETHITRWLISSKIIPDTAELPLWTTASIVTVSDYHTCGFGWKHTETCKGEGRGGGNVIEMLVLDITASY